MDQIPRTYKNAVAYTSDYIKTYFTTVVNIANARVTSALANMVSGAQTAACGTSGTS